MEKVIEQDLWQEHSLHTSEDWVDLQTKCSECYGALKRYRRVENYHDNDRVIRSFNPFREVE